MTVSYVERSEADKETLKFYDAAEERFEMLLNIFKVFGHAPKLGTVFTASVMEMLQDAELDWLTKELLILKATQRNECQYCVVQHEAVSGRLGMSDEKIADIDGDRYRTSPHFSEGERALLDLAVQIGVDANRISDELWARVRAEFTEPQIVEAVYVITQYIAISKFGDALGVVLEPAFTGNVPILSVEHA